MKPIRENDTIQVEITDKCIYDCANCTRFCSLKQGYFMDFETFKIAVDSLVDFPNMIGFQGGEPLLHPEFEKMCNYALSKIPRERLGLWTTLPPKYSHYREIICNTFGNIFINNHSRDDIYHHPFLVAAKDVLKDPDEMYYRINSCFFQQAWSASINPKGAYFCEMAASLAMLYPDLSSGWCVAPGWWKKTPKDYTCQIEEFCQYCGGALFLPRKKSTEGPLWDVSVSNLSLIRDHKLSLKNYHLSDLREVPENEQEPLASYKDQAYRDMIAARFGIFLTTNEKCFNEPYLMHDVYAEDNFLSKLKKRYNIGK